MVGYASRRPTGSRQSRIVEESIMANQRMLIYAAGAVLVVILLIIFATN